MKIVLIIISLILTNTAFCQIEVRGTVYDNSRLNYVEGVRIVSTSGVFSITDTMGRYSILAHMGDSLYFIYNNKPTIKFPVKKIENIDAFDISIKSNVTSKYRVLKEVIIFSKSYKEDSIENRDSYSKGFEFRKPRLESSIDPNGGVGFDADAIINMFRFRHNKQLVSFQNRLIKEEQEKYVNARFGKVIISRVTGLKGQELDSFMVWYRPSYEFLQRCDDIAFNQYLLNASYHFKMIQGTPAKKED